MDAMIEHLVRQRGIRALFHFTPLSNLPSIFAHGLLPRAQLEQRGLPFDFNDELRLDGCPQASSLSIGFPNDLMLRKVRERFPQRRYAVLRLAPELLYRRPCRFLRYNAASSTMRRLNLGGAAQGGGALAAMFDPSPAARRDDWLPVAWPTQSQAEVLLFDALAPELIRAVYVADEADRSAGPPGLLRCDPRWFMGRRQAWRAFTGQSV